MCSLCGLTPEIIRIHAAALPVLRLVTFHRCADCQRIVCSKCSRENSGRRQCKDCSCLHPLVANSTNGRNYEQG
jgi:hypothetical protein